MECIARFEVNTDDIDEIDIPYGGTLIFTKDDYTIAEVEVDFKHLSKDTIDKFVRVMVSGWGKANNNNDRNDFGNGGFFVSIDNKILTIKTCHFGVATSISIYCEESLLRSFREMASYFK